MKISGKKIVSLAVLLLALIGMIYGTVYLKSVRDYQQKVRETVFDEIDISTIPDGTYIGEYDVGFVYAKVEVVVDGGKIAAIRILEHRQERGEAAEAIIDEIIARQTIDVDAVSGATNSSTVIKKAVENALLTSKLSESNINM